MERIISQTVQIVYTAIGAIVGIYIYNKFSERMKAWKRKRRLYKK